MAQVAQNPLYEGAEGGAEEVDVVLAMEMVAGEKDDTLLMGEGESLGNWVWRARAVSWVSIVFTLLVGVVGVVIAKMIKSAATLAFALESFVDVISSILVLWRFWGGEDAEAGGGELGEGGDSAAGGHAQRTLVHREKKASVGIAATFVLISVVVGGEAAEHLATHEIPNHNASLIALAGLSLVVGVILAAVKLTIARNLGSYAMKKDGLCSAAVALLSLAILISAWAGVWWLDSAIAVIVATLLLVYGMRTLIKNRWWTREFWGKALT